MDAHANTGLKTELWGGEERTSFYGKGLHWSSTLGIVGRYRE